MNYPASESPTITQCIECRAAVASAIAAARARVRSGLVFARQIRLELEELDVLLHERQDDVS